MAGKRMWRQEGRWIYISLVTSTILLFVLIDWPGFHDHKGISRPDDTTHMPNKVNAPVITTHGKIFAININDNDINQDFTYSNKETVPPFMIDDRDERIFYSSKVNRDILDEARHKANSVANGYVRVYKDITINPNFSCLEHTGKVAQKLSLRSKSLSIYAACPIAANIPATDAFFLFLSEILPRIAQIHDILKRLPDTPLLLKKTNNPVVLEIIRDLQLPYRFYDKNTLQLQHSLDTCDTPTNSSVLWQMGRHLLGISNFRRVLPRFGQIIFMSNDPPTRLASRILNLDNVLSFLKGRYSDQNVVEFTDTQSLPLLKQTFSQARLVVGMLSENLNALYFCPPATHVLEVVPFHPGGAMVAGPFAQTQTRYWVMSNMLQLSHWRLYEPAHSMTGDITISLVRLRSVLEKVDQIHGMKDE